MKLKIILLSVLIFSAHSGMAQKDIAIPVNQRVIVNYIDFTVYANILATENTIKPADELYYYWFSANDIKRTKGGFDGKLLHGPYTEFYLNKNLKEKGQFRYGLKNNEWKSWYINGEYKEVCDWKNGKRQGRCKLFSEDGKLVEERSYKGDKMHGKCINYSKGITEVQKYRNGELVKSRSRKVFIIRRKDKTAKEGKKEDKDQPAEEQEKDKPKPAEKVKKENKTNVEEGKKENPSAEPADSDRKVKGKKNK